MTEPEQRSAPLLEAKDVHCTFALSEREGLFGPRKKVHALSGVSFSIEPGEAFGVVGESGCGKSTTAKTILNMEAASGGEIYYRGQSLIGLSEQAWKPLRRKIQYVFQDPLGALDPRMSILSQVIEPLVVHNLFSDEDQRLKAESLLRTVGLQSNQFEKFPHQLSGGQRQRVVLARALILDPELLICDEPISALDVSIQAQIINLLQKLRRDMGLTLMFISHDLSVVRHLCDRVAVMYLGRIVEQGSTKEIFSNPRHPYTRALISAIPRPEPGVERKRDMLKGEPPSPVNPPSGCRFHPRCSLATERCHNNVPDYKTFGATQSVACFAANETQTQREAAQ